MSKQLTLPIIHLNGSSPDALTDGYMDATHAVLEAIEAVKATAPHSRDYYPVPGAFEKARDEHSKRLLALQDVVTELQALGKSCRKARRPE